MNAAPPNPLMAKVRTLADRTAAVAEATGATDAATRLRAELARPNNPQTTVVVVGETKRGKSSLLNALLGRPGLVPVDADVATSAHLAITYATTPRATVISVEDGAPQQVEVPVEEIWQYASMGRDPQGKEQSKEEQKDLAAKRRNVQAVRIELDHPLLAQQLSLIDTPGVGGLHAGHAAITMAQLSAADALMFVLDPGAPISAPELEFLAAATQRVSTVLFVVTKIDMFDGWRTIVEDNRKLIAEKAPDFAGAPFFPVSNKLKADADAAAAAGDAEEAAALLVDSGFPPLLEALQARVIGQGENLRATNLCRMTCGDLTVLRREAEIALRSAEGDPTLTAELETMQARYTAFTADTAQWRGDLQNGFSQLSIEMNGKVTQGLNDLEESAQSRLVNVGEDVYERLPEEMSDLIEAFWLDLNSFVNNRASSLIGDVVARFELDGVPIDVEDLPLPDRARAFGELTQSDLPDKPASKRIIDAFYAVVPGMSVLGMAGAVGFAISNPIGWILGGAALFGGARVFFEKGQAQKARNEKDARQYVAKVVKAARELASPMQKHLGEVRIAADKAIGARLTKRNEELKMNLIEHQKMVKTAQIERDRAVALAKRRITDLDALDGEAENLIKAIAAAPKRALLPPTPAARPADSAPAPTAAVAPASDEVALVFDES